MLPKILSKVPSRLLSLSRTISMESFFLADPKKKGRTWPSKSSITLHILVVPSFLVVGSSMLNLTEPLLHFFHTSTIFSFLLWSTKTDFHSQSMLVRIAKELTPILHTTYQSHLRHLEHLKNHSIFPLRHLLLCSFHIDQENAVNRIPECCLLLPQKGPLPQLTMIS